MKRQSRPCDSILSNGVHHANPSHDINSRYTEGNLWPAVESAIHISGVPSGMQAFTGHNFPLQQQLHYYS